MRIEGMLRTTRGEMAGRGRAGSEESGPHLGGRGEFEALWSELHGPVLRAARAYCRHEHDAQDEAQEAWLIWLKRTELSPSPGARAFLLGVLRKRALDRARAGRRRGATMALEEAPQASTQAAPSEPAAFLEFEALVGLLPHRQALVMELHYLHSLSLGTIAARLRVPVGTIASSLSRALQELRRRSR